MGIESLSVYVFAPTPRRPYLCVEALLIRLPQATALARSDTDSSSATLNLAERAIPRRLLAASDVPCFHEVMAMRIDQFTFGSIRTDGVVYEHDVVIARGRVRKRKKKSSNPSANLGERR